MREHPADGARRAKVAIAEGVAIFGSDGEPWGRVEAIGARYLTVAFGLLGHEQRHLPIAFVAHADVDRVELTIPALDAAACATHDPPPDEPIYRGDEPFSEEQQQASGRPLEERPEFGLGTDM